MGKRCHLKAIGNPRSNDWRLMADSQKRYSVMVRLTQLMVRNVALCGIRGNVQGTALLVCFPACKTDRVTIISNTFDTVPVLGSTDVSMTAMARTEEQKKE